mmetsp:Transcript_28812/g.62814  ORF Transcript_28812/g.62814 Transcript_28812/m.62814 type:complete len:217 (-) Transcript_28812:19-669(-)
MGQRFCRCGDRSGEAAASAAEAAASGTACAARGGASRERQYSVEEALALLHALRDTFASQEFQNLLRNAEVKLPKRADRSHPDFLLFRSALQEILLRGYRTVLPQRPWCLEGGWEGYRQMESRMALVADEVAIIRAKEEINQVLRLPRHAQIKPPIEDPVVMPALNDTAAEVFVQPAPLLTDTDGDMAHEFWQEDGCGNLRQIPGDAVMAAGTPPG